MLLPRTASLSSSCLRVAVNPPSTTLRRIRVFSILASSSSPSRSGNFIRARARARSGRPYSTGTKMSAKELEALRAYSACDIADALLKLEKTPPGQVPRAGFLDGIVPLPTPHPGLQHKAVYHHITVGPAFTVLFRPKTSTTTNPSVSDDDDLPPSNIPPGVQWSDLTESGSIVVIQQPEGQKCAVLGGIHALRMAKRGVRGVLVEGRVRDVAEMAGLDSMTIWSRGTSIVGAGAESKPHAVQVPLTLSHGHGQGGSNVLVQPGDLVFCDSLENAAVRIPRDLLGRLLEFLAEHVVREGRIKEMVAGGASVAEAFAQWR